MGKLRRIAKTKKVGHLGTLDPIATGVLPLVIGRATRLAQFYTHNSKTYEGVVRFGWSTDTYDRAGAPTSKVREATVSADALEVLLDGFRGEFLQTPPAVSAKKVEGKRAYELARKSIDVQLQPVMVHVHELTLLSIAGADVTLRVRCSAGTYMRAIAHDLGEQAGCGAHLRDLRRTVSGDFDIMQARTIEQLESLAENERLVEALIPSATMLPHFPSIYVDEVTTVQIRHGRSFPASPFRAQPAAKNVKAISSAGELIAIGEEILPNLYHPSVVF